MKVIKTEYVWSLLVILLGSEEEIHCLIVLGSLTLVDGPGVCCLANCTATSGANPSPEEVKTS